MPIDLDDPIALLLVAAAALERSGADCVAYGGLALGMYGEPRETRDADFAVMSVDLERARLALADLGVDVVIAFANFPSRLAQRHPGEKRAEGERDTKSAAALP